MILIFVLCIISVVSASPAKDTFIVDGEDAQEFLPHHVHLRISSSVNNPAVIYAGSGSLISTRIIVTVAQNVFRFDTFAAGVGSILFKDLEWRGINGMLVHPDYSDTATDSLEYNIALLRLEEEINVIGVTPLTVLNILTVPAPDTLGSISGFGIKDQTGAITISNILQIGTAKVTSQNICLSTYNFLTSLDSHFCAVSEDNTNFCGGDQGTAYYVDDPIMGPTLMGIASTVYDSNDCGADKPALYERASFYYTWLNSDHNFEDVIPPPINN